MNLLPMKKLSYLRECDGCGKTIPSFNRTSEGEIFIRRYVGGHGYLISFAFHKDCLLNYLHEWDIIDPNPKWIRNVDYKPEKEEQP